MLNVYGPQGQILDDGTSMPEVIGDPTCTHSHVIDVEDNSGIEGVTAKQCQICGTGWLIRDKIKGDKNERTNPSN